MEGFFRTNPNLQVSSLIVNRSSSIYLGTESNPATSAQQILTQYPYAPSGVYWIRWNGSTPIRVWCEMSLSGGGWMMILNYVHLGATNPSLLVRTDSLPLMGSEYALGVDESTSTGPTGTWGHASNSMANAFPWTQYMFYGKTSGHSRIIHFSGSVSGVVSYIKTGSGSMSGIGTATLGSLHTANLPAGSLSLFSNQGNSAMTEFPFYTSGQYHWGIRGQGSRWEVDDYPGGSSLSTIHRIWVK
jgi:hypothetical protein